MGSKTPNPGSAEAIERGCKCPVIDNHHGKGVPHGKDGAPLFWINERCSMHMTDKALEAALPGEAEVVAWIRSDDLQEPPERRHVTAWEKVATSWAEGFHPCTPLVTLASLQAMQARAEKAERERDEAYNKGYSARDEVVSACRSRAEAAEARVKEMEEALGGCKKALEAAEARDNHARFRANTPREDAEVVHLRTTAIRHARTALKGGPRP